MVRRLHPAALVGLFALLAGFNPAASAGPGVRTVKPGVKWAQAPSAAQLTASEPAGAGPATAKIECTVATDGRLQLCALRDVRGGAATEAAVNGLLPLYRLSTADAKAIREANGEVVFYLGWRSDTCAPPTCLGVTPPPPPPPPGTQN